MSRFRSYMMLAALLASCGAGAQAEAVWVTDAAAQAPEALSPSRLAAGVRAYPAGVLRALFAVAEQPLLLRQLAEEPERIRQPEEIYPPVSPEQQAAIRELQQVPELVAVAAAYPEELAALRRLYAEAPEGIEARIAELRARYHAEWLAGASAWQRLLQRDRAALEAYGELLTRYCREQLREYAAFPYVEVKQREYYYACPPNELIMAYAQQGETPAALAEVLRSWWERYAFQLVDERVLAARGPIELELSDELVAAWPQQQRAAMWRIPSDQAAGASAMVPVIMQPLDDQPMEARLAFAVAEHARLWAGPQLASELPDAEALEGPAGDEAAPWVVPVEPDDADDDDVAGYAPTPVGVYRDPYDDAERYTSVNIDNYYVNYGSGWPYYYGYPWTWPVIYTSYPSYYGNAVYGTWLGYGPCARVSYYGSRAYVGFHLGAGTTRYYVCPVSRHVYRRHTRRYWRNYGAPYGGPYWRNYGAPYGDHPGWGGRYHRQGTVVVRDYDAGGRRRVAVNRNTVVRPSGPTWGSLGGSTTRRPVVRPNTPRVGPTSGAGSIIRRPTNTSTRSGDRVIRPNSAYPAPGRGTMMRPGSSRQGPTRRPAVSTSPRGSTSSRSPIVRPSRTQRSGGSALHRTPRSSSTTRRSGVSSVPRPRSSSRPPAVRPSSPRRSSSSGIQRSSGRSSGSRVIRPSSPTRQPRGSSIQRRPSQSRSSSGVTRPGRRP